VCVVTFNSPTFEVSIMRISWLRMVLFFLVLALGARGAAAAEPDAAAIATLVRQLGSDDFTTREAAARDPVAIGAPAVAALEAATKSTDVEVASRAKACLVKIQLRARVAELLKTVDSAQERQVRLTAAHELANIAKGDERAFAAIFAMLSEDDKVVQSVAAQCLGKLGMHPKKCVPPMLAFLKANPGAPWVLRQDGSEPPIPTGDHRGLVMAGLRHFGPAAREAIPLLQGIRDNPKEFFRIREAAHDSLTGIWGDNVVAELTKLVESGKGSYAQGMAIRRLTGMGPGCDSWRSSSVRRVPRASLLLPSVGSSSEPSPG
jgi:HEAT repeat protein